MVLHQRRKKKTLSDSKMYFLVLQHKEALSSQLKPMSGVCSLTGTMCYIILREMN